MTGAVTGARRAAAVAALLGAPLAAAQGPVGAARADSLLAAGRPWHAAEALRAAVSRDHAPGRAMLLAGARAELDARRYERARSLLIGQPWIADDAEGLAILGEAEVRLGLHGSAAVRFSAASARASGAAAALLTVREAAALDADGRPDEAAARYAAARRFGLSAIGDWLRLHQARVTRDTAAAWDLLQGLSGPAGRRSGRVRAAVLLLAGDTVGAGAAYDQAGATREAVLLTLGRGDTAAARAALYPVDGRAPSRERARAVIELGERLPPVTPAEHLAHARARREAGDVEGAADAAQRVLDRGDSSAAALLLAGDAFAAAGRLRPAELAYREAARDTATAALALYRRARVLSRLGDHGAVRALAAFADAYPNDSAAAIALYVLAEDLAERGDSAAAGWYAEVIRRYPADPRASLSRFRLASAARRVGRPDSAAALYRAEVAGDGPQALAARFWVGRLRAEAGDSAGARAEWTALAAADSLGYYGLRARDAAGLGPVDVPVGALPAAPPGVASGLARLDTLRLAGLDSAAVIEAAVLVAAPPADLEALLTLSDGLAQRGLGPAAVRLAWLAFTRAPDDPRVVRAIYPWPNRAAVEAEAAEFRIDPMLFAALVRQESVFDADARSPAGARGLAQLVPGTAAQVARGLDVTFEPDWLAVPDLNLHLGAAHLARLLQRYGGRLDAAIAAYNAGQRPVDRWLQRPGASDPDEFLELIPYPETRGYVRSVQRNRWLYAALYGRPAGR